MIKKSLLAGVLSLGLLSSCLGPNNALNTINNWNATIAEQDWINEVLFIPLVFVHGAAWAGDILIFNTIDYWSGNNPISPAGPFPDTFGKGGGSE